jgi:DNA-binding NtrC family response regulator
MREHVCIILNEREPLKLQMAEELEMRIKKEDWACSRLEPSRDITRIILERNPIVLVIDYLLGDVTTALDVLTTLNRNKTHESDEMTKVILWTDEPSVNVAVNAMKLGASDYIELSSANSVDRILACIENCIQDTQYIQKNKYNPSTSSQGELIAQSTTFKECLALACSVSARNQQVTILHGETGTGRNSVARYIHQNRRDAGTYIEIDLDMWPGKAEEIYGDVDDPRIVPLLSHASTVMIDHTEFDVGCLVESICNHRNSIWQNNQDPDNPMLIIGTTSKESATTWAKLLDGEIVYVPALHEREEDFLPLIQRFLQQAHNLSTSKLKLSSNAIEELSKIAWPGNVKQFRASILEAVTTPISQIKEEVKQQDNEPQSVLSKEEQISIRAIIAAKSRWERYHTQNPYKPEPLNAKKAVDSALGNLRVAAASLGTTIPMLRMALGEIRANGLEERNV